MRAYHSRLLPVSRLFVFRFLISRFLNCLRFLGFRLLDRLRLRLIRPEPPDPQAFSRRMPPGRRGSFFLPPLQCFHGSRNASGTHVPNIFFNFFAAAFQAAADRSRLRGYRRHHFDRNIIPVKPMKNIPGSGLDLFPGIGKPQMDKIFIRFLTVCLTAGSFKRLLLADRICTPCFGISVFSRFPAFP